MVPPREAYHEGMAATLLLRLLLAWCLALGLPAGGRAQVIEFESGGLRFQTLTKGGVTIMFAPLPSQVREYSVIQVNVANGSKVSWTLKPEDFRFLRADGTVLAAAPARTVVSEMIERAGRNDVIKLVTNYEVGLYGLQRHGPVNGYEQRRQAAFAEVSSTKLKAAAAASAIAFVSTRLNPGQSTDGAVFYPTAGKPLVNVRLRVAAAGEVFEFEPLLPALLPNGSQ